MCRPWECTSKGVLCSQFNPPWVLVTKGGVEYVESLIQVVIAFCLCIGRECQSILFSCVWYVLAASRECKAHSYCGMHYNGNLQNHVEISGITISTGCINTLFVAINVLHINAYVHVIHLSWPVLCSITICTCKTNVTFNKYKYIFP